jgi:hypothetical protein
VGQKKEERGEGEEDRVVVRLGKVKVKDDGGEDVWVIVRRRGS